MTAIDTAPEPARVAEAKQLMMGGDPRAAIGLLRKHLAQEPSDARAWHRLAGALIADDQLDEALVAATRSAELAPTLAAAHRFVALAQMFRGDWDPALAAVSRAIALDSDDAETHAIRADILLSTGAPLRQVSAAVRRGVEIDPDHRALRAIDRRLRTARRLRLDVALLAAAVGPALVLGLVILLVGAAPQGRPVLPLTAGGCVLVAVLLVRPVARARRQVPARIDLLPMLGAFLLAAGTVAGAVAAAGGRTGPAIGFGLIAVLLTGLVALRIRTLPI